MSSHMIRGRQLSRDTEHRMAMRRNLVQSLFEHGKVRTTMPKALEVRAMAEKLITLARTGTLNARRRVIATLQDRRLVDEDQDFIACIEVFDQRCSLRQDFAQRIQSCDGYLLQRRVLRIRSRHVSQRSREFLLFQSDRFKVAGSRNSAGFRL